jgi:hypothetical protein
VRDLLKFKHELLKIPWACINDKKRILEISSSYFLKNKKAGTPRLQKAKSAGSE